MLLVLLFRVLGEKGRSYKVKKYVVSTFCRGRGVAVAIPILLAISQIR